MSIPWSQAQVISSFGAGGSGTVLGTDGNTVSVMGAFVDTATFSPTSNPAYSGVIVASGTYHEPFANDAALTVSGEPISLKIASGAGTAYTGPADHFLTLTFDFSSVGGGFLPASSYFSVIDLDGNVINGPVGSQLASVTAFDVSGTLISVPWLDTPVNFDYGPDPSTSQPPPGPSDYAAFSGSGGVYSYLGTSTATATPVISAKLLQNIKSIRFEYSGSTLDNTQISFTNTITVPEPSVGLLLLGGWCFLARRAGRPSPVSVMV